MVCKSTLRKQGDLLLRLNEIYHKYIYITNIDSIEKEKQRLLKQLNNKQ